MWVQRLARFRNAGYLLPALESPMVYNLTGSFDQTPDKLRGQSGSRYTMDLVKVSFDATLAGTIGSAHQSRVDHSWLLPDSNCRSSCCLTMGFA